MLCFLIAPKLVFKGWLQRGPNRFQNPVRSRMMFVFNANETSERQLSSSVVEHLAIFGLYS